MYRAAVSRATELGVVVRLAERRDAAGIRAIHNRFVTESTALFDLVPRTLDEQVHWIDEHSGGHPAVVAVLDGNVVGFGSLSPFRARPAYATTVEDSVYIVDEHQRAGIGLMILEELMEKVNQTRRQSRVTTLT